VRTSSVPERRVPARSSRGKPCHELTHHVRAGLVEGQLALDGIARNNLGEHFMLPMEARPALEPQADADISYTERNLRALAVPFRPPSLIGNRVRNGIAEGRQGLLARPDHLVTNLESYLALLRGDRLFKRRHSLRGQLREAFAGGSAGAGDQCNRFAVHHPLALGACRG